MNLVIAMLHDQPLSHIQAEAAAVAAWPRSLAQTQRR